MASAILPPATFDRFLASIGTCAGFYVLRFCQRLELPIEDLRLLLNVDRNEERYRLNSVRLTIHLSAGFPEKYARANILAVDQCSVKRAILDSPILRL